MKDYIKIQQLSRAVLKKCECCDKVQDIFYRVDILNYRNKDLLEGSLFMCRNCGSNFNKLLGNELEIEEKITKKFNLSF